MLITGASGFIGGEIAAQLTAANKTVHSGYFTNMPGYGIPVQFDITDIDSIDNVIPQAKPDIIIHCAYDKTPANRDAVIVTGTENVVNSALRYAPDARFIFMSSEWVFDGLAGPYWRNRLAKPANRLW